MKIGFLSLPLSGHLNPMTALARMLQSRGHEVVFFGVLDVESVVRAAGLAFIPFCEKDFPLGSMAKSYEPVSRLYGEEIIRYHMAEIYPGHLRVMLEHLPGKLAETGVDALVIDFVHSYIQLVAMNMGIPFVQIWNVLNIDFSGATPACAYSWPHETNPEALARNQEGVAKLVGHFASLLPIAQAYAEKAGLKIDWNDPAATLSPLAIISQTPKEFDFPGIPWPPQFHYAGPFHDGRGRAQLDFPWDQLSDKPLIYASLGTLVNGLDRLYITILQALKAFPEMQAVLSVGKNVNLDDLGPIPSNTLVVRSAPQVELLKRATICITHAGLNTALESVAQGVPMVAIPIGYDQPGVAARIAYHGVGEFVEVDDLTAEGLIELLRRVMSNPAYRDKARYFQEVIAQTRGLDVAADVIEEAFQTTQAKDRMESEALTRA